MSAAKRVTRKVRKEAGRVRKRLRREAMLAITRTETRLARRQESKKNHDEALRLLDDVVRRNPKNTSAVAFRAQVQARTGRLEEALTATTQIVVAGSTAANRHRHRMLQGRYIENHPLWRPEVPGPAPDGPPNPGTVLYLAKESMPHRSNGYCTRTHETLVAVRGAGWTPVAVTFPGFPEGVDRESARMSVVDGVEYHHVQAGLAPNLTRLSWEEQVQFTTTSWARELARVRPEVLHAGSGNRGYDFAVAGAALARWAGLPWLYEVRSFFETTWTADERYAESAPYYHRRFEAETRSMHQAGAVVTLSGPMRDEIIGVRGVDPDRVFVIPNAVDLTRFTPAERDADLRRRIGFGPDTFVLGYISNLDHYREGQEVLLKATAELRRQGLDVSVLLVGDGRRRPELERLARSLGLGAAAHFAGSVPFDQVAAWYAQIDLFVVPRIDERAGRLVSPMKPFEAMAMRVPIMVSDLPALVEIAGDGEERAFVFRAGDEHSLAARVTRLLGDRDALAQRVERSAGWVAAERSWEANGRAFAEVYRFVQEEHRGAGLAAAASGAGE